MPSSEISMLSTSHDWLWWKLVDSLPKTFSVHQCPIMHGDIPPWRTTMDSIDGCGGMR